MPPLSRKHLTDQVPGFFYQDGVLGLQLEVKGRVIRTRGRCAFIERFLDVVASAEPHALLCIAGGVFRAVKVDRRLWPRRGSPVAPGRQVCRPSSMRGGKKDPQGKGELCRT